ncbi:MAG: hypothetical protein JRD89_04380 [Deltaproteobacteria bacterium]|nr:hypothetical protein [Deltaproteobacteria bacterium]
MVAEITEGVPRPDVYITFPPEGGWESVPKGTTTADLFMGVVTLPDGTRKKMSGSLSATGFGFARSVLVEATKEVIVNLDGRGKFTISAGEFLPILFQRFRTVYIETTEDTSIRLWASTNPEGVPRMLGIGIENLRNRYRDSVINTSVAADTDVFGSDITADWDSIMRIFVASDTAAVCRVKLTRGTTTVTLDLNSGSTLTANSAYIFDVVTKKGDKINVRFSAAVTVLICTVFELDMQV